jgi:SAM-dependent methyltransferase
MSSGDQLFTDGAAYERLMGRWSRRVGDVFIDWIAVPDGLGWLDIGCGTGAFTEQLIQRCRPASVTAIDPSADQLAFARNRTGAEKAEFRVGDAQDLQFPDGSFDIAVMALVVHFIPDPGKAIAELARVVRPGGRAATYVWDYIVGGSPTAPIAAAMKEIGLKAAGPPSPNATAIAALEALWRSAGFVDVETRAIRIAVEFTDFDEFWDSMTGRVGPAGKAIAALQPDGLTQLRAALQQRMPLRPDGRVVYEACANAIKGRKSP